MPNHSGGGNRKIFTTWLIMLLMYISLLSSIGYLAFFDQDFNKPNKFVEDYLTLINKASISSSDTNKSESIERITVNEDFRSMIQDITMKRNDNAGDLQELASQSFNVILGALLAFLSATATTVFQSMSEKNTRYKIAVDE